jgi:hypothetical protein
MAEMVLMLLVEETTTGALAEMAALSKSLHLT